MPSSIYKHKFSKSHIPSMLFFKLNFQYFFIFIIIMISLSHTVESTLMNNNNKGAILPSTNLQRNQRQIQSTGKIISSVVGPTLLGNLNIQNAFASSNKISSVIPPPSLSNDDWAKKVEITDILFIRHAQSYNNVLYDSLREKYGDTAPKAFLRQERWKLRQSDCGLSSKGVEQANRLQAFAQRGGLSSVLKSDSSRSTKSLDDYLFVSSPMQRCLLTSQALSVGLQKPVYVHPSLYESGGCYRINEGGSTMRLSGTKTKVIESTFPRFKCFPGMEHGWYQGKTSAAVETHKEFKTRAQSIVDWIWSVHETPPDQRQLHGVPFRHLVFVIHGNLLNAVISGLQGGQGLITHSNTGFSRVELLTGRNNKRVAVVKYLNRLDHIRPETDAELMTGNDTVGDSWIQEFQRDD